MPLEVKNFLLVPKIPHLCTIIYNHLQMIDYHLEPPHKLNSWSLRVECQPRGWNVRQTPPWEFKLMVDCQSFYSSSHPKTHGIAFALFGLIFVFEAEIKYWTNTEGLHPPCLVMYLFRHLWLEITQTVRPPLLDISFPNCYLLSLPHYESEWNEDSFLIFLIP